MIKSIIQCAVPRQASGNLIFRVDQTRQMTHTESDFFALTIDSAFSIVRGIELIIVKIEKLLCSVRID